MKRLFAVLITISLVLTFFASCGGKDRELYSKTKLSKYVEVSDYMGIEIDTASDEFKNYYNAVIESDIDTNGFYRIEGVVADGDTVNIDFIGKKNGVAFEGGTANGAQLVIGSDSFIDGFEDGLIGVAIGSTVDLNLTFPEDYHSTELAGEDVVFTVTVNHNYANFVPEEYYSRLGFDSLNDYIKDVKKRAAQSYIFNSIIDSAKIMDYPADQQELVAEALYENSKIHYEAQEGIPMEQYLAKYGYTVESYKAYLLEEAVPDTMQRQLVIYYIFDEENLELTEEDIEKQTEEPRAIAETYAVRDIVLDYLYDNAVVK